MHVDDNTGAYNYCVSLLAGGLASDSEHFCGWFVAKGERKNRAKEVEEDTKLHSQIS